MCRKTNTKTNTRVAVGRCLLGLAVFGVLVSCAGAPDKVVKPETVKSTRPDTIISGQSGKEWSNERRLYWPSIASSALERESGKPMPSNILTPSGMRTAYEHHGVIKNPQIPEIDENIH